MANESPGEGWWQASDGRWYPPESRRSELPPPPPEPTDGPRAVPPPATTGNGFSTAGIVCGCIAFLVPLVGIVGLVLGFVARSKGEQKARTALTVSTVGLVGGFILGLLLTSTL